MGRSMESRAVFSRTITDERETALAVDVMLVEEGGGRLLVRSAGLTVAEAVERAIEFAEDRLGGRWEYEDWAAG